MGSNEKDRRLKKELFDIENDFLDEELTKEENILDNEPNKKCLNNNVTDSASGLLDQVETCSPCCKRKGIITHLTTTNGIIDNSIKFDKKIAPLFQDLHTGCVVEYIVYETDSKVEKIVKIENIIEHNWEETTVTKVIT